MDLGSHTNNFLRQQRPSYHVAPSFNIPPPPNGPLDLGTIVDNIKQYDPINEGADNRVHIPLSKRYSDVKEETVTSLSASHGGEGNVFTKVFHHNIGGGVSFKGQKKDHIIINARQLKTEYFHPPPSYITQCLQLSCVKEFLEGCRSKLPIYLVTGLKIASGATICTDRGRNYEGAASGSVSASSGAGDIGVEAKAGVACDSEMNSSFGKPADFLLGIQVLKIYHKRICGIERGVRSKRLVQNAVLMDNEMDIEETDTEENFIIADLDDAETEGLVPWVGNISEGNEQI